MFKEKIIRDLAGLEMVSKKNSLDSVSAGKDWCLCGSGIIFMFHTYTYTPSHTQSNNSEYHLEMSTKSDTCMENMFFLYFFFKAKN